MLYLQGTIGYTIFINPITKKKIIVFADMHDNLPPCPFKNSIKISRWFEKKFKTAILLLEEVVRNNNIKLEGLWNSSDHTTELKNLFLSNKNKIEAIDIRPYLIPFSWEIIQQSEDKHMIFKNYFKDFLKFLKLEIDLIIIKKNFHNNQKIKEHFKQIKKKFLKYLLNNKKLLNKTIFEIYQNNLNVLEDFNVLLNDCMEWYICVLIDNYKHKTIMIHAGLYHTEKVNNLLKNFYNFEKIYEIGINYLNDKSLRSELICQPIEDNLI